MKSLGTVYTRAFAGIEAPLVAVEAHITSGLPKFHIVGLAETAVKESKERVRSAIINANYEFPAIRITVNLAPADLPKSGGRFDLAIALGILIASYQLPAISTTFEFGAELALSGELRGIHAALPFALASLKNNHYLIVAEENQDELSALNTENIYCAKNLL